jgi:hypothetical protein
LSDVATVPSVSIRNLTLKQAAVAFTKSITIENPAAELVLLEQMAKLGGEPKRIEVSDAKQNPQEFMKLLEKKLQGSEIYDNDNCPEMGSFATLYDLETALGMLRNIKAQLGSDQFSKVKVVFVENFLGSDLKQLCGLSNPVHHLIERAYTVPAHTKIYRAEPNRLKDPKNSGYRVNTLQLFESGRVQIERLIENPQLELTRLKKLAGRDGDATNISEQDLLLDKKSYDPQLGQLQGLDLYTNDTGFDATLFDLNASYNILLEMAKDKIPLQERKLIFKEKLLPANSRHVIDHGYVVDENADDFNVQILNP